jgi:hypothetical protein
MATHTLLIESIKSLESQLKDIPGIFVEIGSQRHPGQGSSFQLQQLAASQKRKFLTIDADADIAALAHSVVGNCSIYGKGEDVLAADNAPIVCLYLDNYDVIYSETHASGLKDRIGNHYEQTLGYSFKDAHHQNFNSALVHLQQLKAAFGRLTEKCIVAVDDTTIKKANSFLYYWGKGCAVVPVLLQSGFTIHANNQDGVVLQRGLVVPDLPSR